MLCIVGDRRFSLSRSRSSVNELMVLREWGVRVQDGHSCLPSCSVLFFRFGDIFVILTCGVLCDVFW